MEHPMKNHTLTHIVTLAYSACAVLVFFCVLLSIRAQAVEQSTQQRPPTVVTFPVEDVWTFTEKEVHCALRSMAAARELPMPSYSTNVVWKIELVRTVGGNSVTNAVELDRLRVILPRLSESPLPGTGTGGQP